MRSRGSTIGPCRQTRAVSRMRRWSSMPSRFRPRPSTAAHGSSTLPCARSPSTATSRPRCGRSPSAPGVSLRAFYSTFDGKEDALIWAYDVAAAYAIPQILRAIQAERDWERGAAAALGAYLAILDCDRDWAVACLRDVPAAGERVRAARDAVRAPILKALETRAAQAGARGGRHDADRDRRHHRRRPAPCAGSAAIGAKAGADGLRAGALRRCARRHRAAWRAVDPAVEPELRRSRRCWMTARRAPPRWSSWCRRPRRCATARRSGA